MSGLARAAETRAGRAVVDGLAGRGVLWPLLAARSGRAPSGADGRRERVLSALGLNPSLPQRLVGPRTDVCIEGFPRSGNSYVIYAFGAWNPGARVAHHVHAALQLRRAVRFGVPCCLLVRAPLEAVASVAVMTRARVSDGACYRSYIRFHERARPLVDGLVVCRFDEVVEDPSIVVARLNQRFDTAFASEPVTPEVRAFFGAELERVVRDRFRVRGIHAPVPSAEKDRLKGELQARLAEHPLRGRAEAAYAALASPQPGSGVAAGAGAGAGR